MPTPPLVIDATWARGPPAAKDRIAAGWVVLRREGRAVSLAPAREGDLPPCVLPKGGVELGEPLNAAAFGSR
jgi:hypothetical protein